MKKIISIVIFVCILTSCSRISNLDNNNYSIHATDSDSIEESRLIYLTEQTDNNLISIEVPVFDINKSDIIENDIINYIKNYLYDITGVKFYLLQSNNNFLQTSEMDVSEVVAQYDYYIDIDHRISIQNEECISIIFEGILNKSTAAHPIHLFFTYNINPETCERILFSDKYCIDNNLYNTVFSYFKENIVGESNTDAVVHELLDENEFYNGLSGERIISCYYTKEAVGISIPVNYALGNHFEVEIPYKSLKLK